MLFRSSLTSTYTGDIAEGECGGPLSVHEDMAWVDGNSGGQTHPVAQKLANAWGLHDMPGNIYEWCLDAYRRKLPGGHDPLMTSGPDRVYRAGSWSYAAEYCRSANRGWNAPGNRFYYLGLRLACVPHVDRSRARRARPECSARGAAGGWAWGWGQGRRARAVARAKPQAIGRFQVQDRRCNSSCRRLLNCSLKLAGGLVPPRLGSAMRTWLMPARVA